MTNTVLDASLAPSTVALTLIGSQTNVDVTQSGRDSLTGGSGNDTLIGNFGVDTLNGGDGDDTFVFNNLGEFVSSTDVTYQFGNAASPSTATVSGGNVIDSVTGGNGTDIVRVDAPITLTTANTLARVNTVEVLKQNHAGAANIVIDTDAKLSSIRSMDLSSSTAASTVTLAGVTQGVSVTGGSGADNLTGGSGADTLTGSTGIDTYNLGSDTAIDTVVEAGSAVTKDATSGAISGFDLIQGFVTGQDVLSFNGGTGKQLTGTYTAGANGAIGTFVVGAGNDVIVFNDASGGTTGVVDAGEAAVVLIGLAANGVAVDLNGAGATGNGYGG